MYDGFLRSRKSRSRACCVAVTVALQEAERDERVEKVARRAGMQTEPPAQRLERLWAARQLGEDAQLDGAQERLRAPEAQPVCRIFSGFS